MRGFALHRALGGVIVSPEASKVKCLMSAVRILPKKSIKFEFLRGDKDYAKSIIVLTRHSPCSALAEFLIRRTSPPPYYVSIVLMRRFM